MSHGAFESEVLGAAEVAADAPDAPVADRRRPSGELPAATDLALAKHPVLAGVGQECFDAVMNAGAVKVYEPGDHLTRVGDTAAYFFVLLSGSARVYFASRDGLEVTARLYGAPSAWGEMELLHQQRYSESCVAVDRARVLRLPKAEFLAVMREYPQFMLNVLRDASARLLLATQHERATALLGVNERVADLILSYVRMYGVPVDGGTMIRIPLSQHDIAQGLGVALKSVSRAFHELLGSGVMEKRGARYIVKDVAALRAQTAGLSSGIDWIAGRDLAA